MITGFLLEASIGHKALHFTYPANVYILIVYCVGLVALYYYFRKQIVISWLADIPSAISSIVLVTFLVLIMGIIPQVPTQNTLINTLGLNEITSNWAFLLVFLQFLTGLGLAAIKRLFQLSRANTGFILNHLGLFIVLLSGFLGSGDLQRLTLDTYENQLSWVARDANQQAYELPFAVYLNDFNIEEYAPKLALVDNHSGQIMHNNGKNLYHIAKGKTYYYDRYKVHIDDYINSSGFVGGRYLPVNEPGSPPSALIKIEHLDNKEVVKGWISCGSFRYPYRSLKVDADVSMVMTFPEVKKFSSNVDIITPDQKKAFKTIEVNKPVKFQGWTIYQLSYDEQKGKWSNKSVLELVKDPWLPVIYWGIFMMIAGAVYMFWTGSRITKKHEV